MYYFQPTEQYIDLLATALADENITIKKSDAWHTDIEHRVLYYEPMSMMNLDPIQVKGVIMHEIGHLKYSQCDESTQLEKDNPAIHTLYNCFEDMRVDEKIIKQYGDFASEAMESYYVDALSKFFFSSVSLSPFHQFLHMSMMAYFYYCRIQRNWGKRYSEYINADINYQLSKWFSEQAYFDAYYGPQYSPIDKTVKVKFFKNIDLIKTVINQIVEMDQINQMKALVDEKIYPIIKDLLPEANKEEEKKQKQQSQSQQSQSGANLQSKSSSQSTPASAKSGQQSTSSSKSSVNNSNPGMSDRVAQLLEKIEDELDEKQKRDLKHIIGNNGRGGQSVSISSIEAKAIALRHANTLSEKIKSILKERACVRYQGNHKTGKLLNRNAYKILLNENRAFSKRNNPDTPEYKLWLILDCSGSMLSDGKAVSTFISANMLDQVGKFLKFKREYIAFDEVVHPLKTLDEYKNRIGGGTDDIKCLQHLDKEVSPDDDNLIFIISDGDSNGDPKPLIKSLIKKNSTVVGVCFPESSSSASHMAARYEDYIIVEDPTKLPNLLVRKLQSLIHR